MRIIGSVLLGVVAALLVVLGLTAAFSASWPFNVLVPVVMLTAFARVSLARASSWARTLDVVSGATMAVTCGLFIAEWLRANEVTSGSAMVLAFLVLLGALGAAAAVRGLRGALVLPPRR